MDVPYLEKDEIRSAARRLREDAFGESVPVPVDLEALVFDYLYDEHGVAFFNDRPLGREKQQDVLGVTYPFKNEIHVDGRLASEGHVGRYRFTVAHEIGHWVLHRPLFLEGEGRDRSGEAGDAARLVTLQRDVVGPDEEATHDYRPEEWQANIFAIWLLLPEDALESEFVARYGEPPFDCPPAWRTSEAETPLRWCSRALAATPKDQLVALHETFLLSIEATAIALEERGYLAKD